MMNAGDAEQMRTELWRVHRIGGATIMSVGFDQDDPSYTCINIKTVDDKHLTLWVQADPEGNGGGFLHVEQFDDHNVPCNPGDETRRDMNLSL